MIPKKIHYCWFGGNPKSKLIEKCIESWKLKLPNYEITEWNETNLNINTNNFIKEAYKQKKWAFVSDYVRAYALYTQGGVYLDTDVEIKMNIDEFLHHGAFSGFESKNAPFTALWASEKKHIWPELVLKYYENRLFSEKTNTKIVSDILVSNFGVNPKRDQIQNLKHNICIYPSSHFCVDIPVNYAVHHFEGSWKDRDISYKGFLTNLYHTNEIMKNKDFNVLIKGLNIRGDKEKREITLLNIRLSHIFKHIFLKRILKLKG